MDFARASKDFNALDSCIKPTIALTNTTPNITLQSAHCFKNNVIKPEIINTYKRLLWNCKKNLFIGPSPFF